MNDDATNDDRPFGHDTLKLRGVFVPEGNPGQVSRADIAGVLGYDVVRIPAVLVPVGHTGPRPGYPYVWFGRVAMGGPAEPHI